MTRIKPRSAANARDQHLNIPNINTPWKAAIKRLVHNIQSVNSVSLLSKARPANKHDCSKGKQFLFVSLYHLVSIGLEVLNYMTTWLDTDSTFHASHMSCRTRRWSRLYYRCFSKLINFSKMYFCTLEHISKINLPQSRVKRMVSKSLLLFKDCNQQLVKCFGFLPRPLHGWLTTYLHGKVLKLRTFWPWAHSPKNS